jgi:reactive intermediate/imine deaminase
MKIRVLLSLAAALGLGGCHVTVTDGDNTSVPASSTSGGAPVYYPTRLKADPPLPFAEAVRVGDMLYVTGQLGTLPGTTQVAPGGIGPEARQVMENIKAILERHGSSLDHVVKCTVFLADMKEWPAFNEVYRQYFPTHFPARSAFGTTGLAFGARVEVECIAWVPSAAK